MLRELIDEIEERLRLIIREEFLNALEEMRNPNNNKLEVKKTTKDFPTILNADDIAGFLGITVQRVYELVRSRKSNGFPVILLGERQYRFSKEEVLEWIKRGGSNK